MIKKTRIMDVVAVITLGVAAVTPWVVNANRPTRAPEPPTPPRCVVEDGGPIPCTWHGPDRPGHQESITITVTAAP